MQWAGAMERWRGAAFSEIADCKMFRPSYSTKCGVQPAVFLTTDRAMNHTLSHI